MLEAAHKLEKLGDLVRYQEGGPWRIALTVKHTVLKTAKRVNSLGFNSCVLRTVREDSTMVESSLCHTKIQKHAASISVS